MSPKIEMNASQALSLTSSVSDHGYHICNASKLTSTIENSAAISKMAYSDLQDQNNSDTKNGQHVLNPTHCSSSTGKTMLIIDAPQSELELGDRTMSSKQDLTTQAENRLSSFDKKPLDGLNDDHTMLENVDSDDDTDSDSTFQFIETDKEDYQDSFDPVPLDQFNSELGVSLQPDNFAIHRGVIMHPVPFSRNSGSVIDLKYLETKKPLKRAISENCLWTKESHAVSDVKNSGLGRKFAGVSTSRLSSSNLNDANVSRKVEEKLSSDIQEPSTTKSKPKRKVSWDKLEVREYDQTLGDNPSVSYGPPVGLDWQYTVLGTADIEYFEENRLSRRNSWELNMNYYVRTNLLQDSYNFSESDIKRAMKEVNRTKMRRSITNALWPASKMEEVVASAIRKTKRVVQKKSKKDMNIVGM